MSDLALNPPLLRARFFFRITGFAVCCGIAVQFLLAGMAVFGAGAGFEIHSIMGGVLGLPVILVTVLSFTPSLRGHRGPALLLLALYVLQIALAALGRELPMLGALHPVNGLAMAFVAGRLLRPQRN
jgi:hypothetical protein